MTHLTTLSDAEAVARHAASDIARWLDQARQTRGHAHVALSGGDTPARTYQLLGQTLADWEGIEVWFADERCVAPDDERSNYRLAHEALLGPAGVPAEQVHRMQGELGPHEGARRYAQELRAHQRAHTPRPQAQQSHAALHGGAGHEHTSPAPALDLAILGIGPEGHIASLFPNAPMLDASEQELCLGVTDSPKPPPERITLSLPVLRAARRCLVIATGEQKAGAISAMLGEPTREVPASLLARERLSVIVDEAASGAPDEPWLTHSP